MIKNNFCNIKSTKIKLLQNLKEIGVTKEQKFLSDDEKYRRCSIENQLNNILAQEKILWK